MKDAIANRLFENGVNSIELGVEDFLMASNDDRRYVSSARNIFAGIFLLFKAYLAEESCSDAYSLLRRAFDLEHPDKGRDKWKDIAESETLLYPQCKNRMPDEVEWGRVDVLHDYRNKIEHFYIKGQVGVPREHLSRAFVVIRDFLNEVLKIDPKSCLSKKVWDALMHNQEVYEKERRESEDAIDHAEWIDTDIAELSKESFMCPECGSTLVGPDLSTDLMSGTGDI